MCSEANGLPRIRTVAHPVSIHFKFDGSPTVISRKRNDGNWFKLRVASVFGQKKIGSSADVLRNLALLKPNAADHVPKLQIILGMTPVLEILAGCTVSPSYARVRQVVVALGKRVEVRRIFPTVIS